MSDDLLIKACTLMLASSCFGREVCPGPPCACAQSLIDMIGRAAVEAERAKLLDFAQFVANHSNDPGVQTAAHGILNTAMVRKP